MKSNIVKQSLYLAVAGILALVSGCNSGNSSGASVAQEEQVTTPQPTTQAQPLADNDFTFPAITETNGSVVVAVPEGPLPTFSARRTLSNGTGSVVSFGDPVVVRYSMYSWSSGELVETTDAFDEPITVQAGVTEGIPDYLSKSLLGRNIGDQLQLVFEAGMSDLPEYLDNSDAYILVVNLI